MKDSFIYHALLGNDTKPWIVAAARGLLEAILAGSLAVLAIWLEVDDVKVLITAFLLPFIGVIAARVGLEGIVDTLKP